MIFELDIPDLPGDLPKGSFLAEFEAIFELSTIDLVGGPSFFHLYSHSLEC